MAVKLASVARTLATGEVAAEPSEPLTIRTAAQTPSDPAAKDAGTKRAALQRVRQIYEAAGAADQLKIAGAAPQTNATASVLNGSGSYRSSQRKITR